MTLSSASEFFKLSRCLFFDRSAKSFPHIVSPNSCHSSAAQYHKAAFKGNWLFIYVSACCHILFTLLTEKPFMSQNCFHMLPLLPAWQHCRALTLSTGRLAWPLMLGVNIYTFCHFVFVPTALCQSRE